MNRYLLAISMLGVFAVQGCVTNFPEGPAPGIRVRDSQALYAGIQLDRVVILDKSLQNWYGKVYDPPWSAVFLGGTGEGRRYAKIAVESTDTRRTATGTLEVWAVFRNRTDSPLQLECRTQFFDAAEVPSEGPSAWSRLHLPPQGVDKYRTTSKAIEGIRHYYIEVREGR